MTKKGIDISYCQTSIDWDNISVDYVIARAGYGRLTSQKDNMFDKHYASAKAKGIPVGAYWYSYAMTEDEARAEANACIEVLKGKQLEYPIYYDVEEQKQYALGKAKVSAIIKAFCSELEKAGYFVGVYTNTSWYNTVIDDSIKTRYSIWIAHWDVSKPGIDGAYAVWQYKVGPLAGVKGDVDQDYCYVDFEKIIKERGFNGYGKQPESTPEGLFNNISNISDIRLNTIHVVTIIDGERYEGDLVRK